MSPLRATTDCNLIELDRVNIYDHCIKFCDYGQGDIEVELCRPQSPNSYLKLLFSHVCDLQITIAIFG